MKRTAFLLILAAALGFGISSCEKCTVCTATAIDIETVSQYCGNELDVRDYEKFFLDSLSEIEVAGYCERGPTAE